MSPASWEPSCAARGSTPPVWPTFRKQRAQGKLKQSPPEQKVTQRKHDEAARQRDARKLLQMQKEIQHLTGLLELQKNSRTCWASTWRA